MCEIAILSGDEYTPSKLAMYSMVIYKSQQDSLGIVAIHEDGDRKKFRYNTYKSVSPEESRVEEFFRNNDEALRFIIHGRLATAGKVNVKNAHPIEIECSKCNIDYLIHNGVCTTAHRTRMEHKKDGHDYETRVDSEVIAHEYGDVPTSFDECKTDQMEWQPAYILLNEDAIYINNGGRYHLTERGDMAKPKRDFANDALSGNYVEVIITPHNAN